MFFFKFHEPKCYFSFNRHGHKNQVMVLPLCSASSTLLLQEPSIHCSRNPLSRPSSLWSPDHILLRVASLSWVSSLQESKRSEIYGYYDADTSFPRKSPGRIQMK
eukprot:TRINITY_DN34042_c1_g1_i3.p1 TRINITY_DN34042_c1_g1~~TRINITY_DN34042_c1_g1_i3.p1  ORF type:complete len:105 (-),score=18.76 TRINITY_DN34042_c1_g1_i3:763-1077(-)